MHLKGLVLYLSDPVPPFKKWHAWFTTVPWQPLFNQMWFNNLVIFPAWKVFNLYYFTVVLVSLYLNLLKNYILKSTLYMFNGWFKTDSVLLFYLPSMGKGTVPTQLYHTCTQQVGVLYRPSCTIHVLRR